MPVRERLFPRLGKLSHPGIPGPKENEVRGIQVRASGHPCRVWISRPHAPPPPLPCTQDASGGVHIGNCDQGSLHRGSCGVMAMEAIASTARSGASGYGGVRRDRSRVGPPDGALAGASGSMSGDSGGPVLSDPDADGANPNGAAAYGIISAREMDDLHKLHHVVISRIRPCAARHGHFAPMRPTSKRTCASRAITHRKKEFHMTRSLT